MATHHEVASNWLAQTGKKPKGFAMFYWGDTIYSYGSHFPIARLTYVNGERVALFTTRDYSVSTAKHKTIVYRVLIRSHTVKHVFHVDDVRASETSDNVRAMQAQAASLRERAKRARVYGPSLLVQATEIEEHAALYMEKFSVVPA